MSYLQPRQLLLIAVVCVGVASIAPGGNSITYAPNVNQVMTTTITVGTSYVTSLSQPQTLVNGPLKVISTTGTNLPCELWNFTFTAVQGQYLSVNFTSNIPLNVYVVQDAKYQSWLNQGSCGDQADAVSSKMLTVSYNFTGVLPNTGRWTLVLVNLSNTRDADGFMTAYLATGNFVTGELLSTITTTSTPASVTTMSTGPEGPSTGVPGFPAESIVLGFAIGLAALIILRQRKRIVK
jgi:hypothetical protein